MRFRAFISLLAFVAGFAAACSVISRLVPPVRAAPIDGKLAYFAQKGDEFDTVIIGSSRIYRQIIPDVFDAEMASLGFPVNSFNLSADGMRPPEDMHVLDCALGHRSKPLRLVISECSPIDSNLDGDDAGTARAVYWHDSARMALLLRACFNREATASGPGELSISGVWRDVRALPPHFQHWAWNESRVGAGNESLIQMIFSQRPGSKLLDERASSKSGWRAPSTRDPMKGKELANYERDVAEARDKRPRPDYDDEESQAALSRKRDLAARLGALLVLVATPAPRSKVFTPRETRGILFLDHTDPDEFPELYPVSARRDPGHLNEQGAVLYTRIIARQIAETLRKQN